VTKFSRGRRGGSRIACRCCGLLAAAVFICSVLCGALAAPAPAAVAIELNRFDDQNGSCRVSFVIANPGADSYSGFKLDLVVFDRGGMIARRLAADVAPLREQKTSVKVFDISGTPCAEIGSILVNDILDCRGTAGPVGDCVGRITVSSKLSVSLLK
jgi:hypothetical protein